MSEAFLSSLLRTRSSRVEEARKLWEGILKAAFGAFKDKTVDFTEHQKLAAALKALDVLLRQPPLQHALVSHLCQICCLLQAVQRYVWRTSTDSSFAGVHSHQRGQSSTGDIDCCFIRRAVRPRAAAAA